MITPPDTQTVRFTQEDLELFRDASGDRNPLHLSHEYASKTAYGQQVVFGALGAVACLGRLPHAADRAISKLTADFHRPIFLDASYTIRVSEQGPSRIARLQDGTVPVLTLAIQYREEPEGHEYRGGTAQFARAEATELNISDLPAGKPLSGVWAADSAKTGELCRHWHVGEENRAV